MSTSPPITSLEGYLESRKQLIASRDVLFSVTRMYLRPGQNPDAQLLGDRLWNSPARTISDDEWVVNAARGYMAVLANADKGRGFQLIVLQQGMELQIAVQLPAWYADPKLPQVIRFINTFGPVQPKVTNLPTDELLVEWTFSAVELYTDARAVEDAVRRIGSVFECALQSFTPTTKSPS